MRCWCHFPHHSFENIDHSYFKVLFLQFQKPLPCVSLVLEHDLCVALILFIYLLACLANFVESWLWWIEKRKWTPCSSVWLQIRLCLPFAVAIGVNSSFFLLSVCVVFFFLVVFEFFPVISSQADSKVSIPLNHCPCYYTGGLSVWWDVCWGKHSIILWLALSIWWACVPAL